MPHFEELWEQCEKFHQESDGQENNPALIEEVMMKFNLYQVIDSRQDLSAEEKQTLKAFTLGEVLLTLTHLSLNDNIDVYKALQTALKFKSIDNFNQKYP
jgi:hypothetical protein